MPDASQRNRRYRVRDNREGGIPHVMHARVGRSGQPPDRRPADLRSLGVGDVEGCHLHQPLRRDVGPPGVAEVHRGAAEPGLARGTAAPARSSRGRSRRHRPGRRRRRGPAPRRAGRRRRSTGPTPLSSAFTAIAAMPYGSTSLATTARGAGQRRGDGDQAAARAQVEHGAAGDDLGVVEHVPGQRLAAGPRRRPERRLGAGVHLARPPSPPTARRRRRPPAA